MHIKKNITIDLNTEDLNPKAWKPAAKEAKVAWEAITKDHRQHQLIKHFMELDAKESQENNTQRAKRTAQKVRDLRERVFNTKS